MTDNNQDQRPHKMTAKGHLKAIFMALIFAAIAYSIMKVIYYTADHFGLHG